MRAAALALLIACGGPAAPVAAPPTAIGAAEPDSDEPPTSRGSDSLASALLAQLPPADLMTEEGREVLAFSAAVVMAAGTLTLMQRPRDGGEGQHCFVQQTQQRADGTTVESFEANDCAVSSSQRASGRLVMEQRENACGKYVRLVLDDWRVHRTLTCPDDPDASGTQVYDGVVVNDDCTDAMSVDLRMGGEGVEQVRDGCRPIRATAIRYRLRSTGPEGARLLHGSGDVGIEGVGRAAVETHDQRLAGQDCNTEARSGLTRAAAAGHVAQVTYDGATSCSDPGRAPLTLDGQPAGESPHACAAGGEGAALGWLALAALLVGRRRRR